MIISRVHKRIDFRLCTLNVSPGCFFEKVTWGLCYIFILLYKMKAAKLFVRRKKK